EPRLRGREEGPVEDLRREARVAGRPGHRALHLDVEIAARPRRLAEEGLRADELEVPRAHVERLDGREAVALVAANTRAGRERAARVGQGDDEGEAAREAVEAPPLGGHVRRP